MGAFDFLKKNQEPTLPKEEPKAEPIKEEPVKEIPKKVMPKKQCIAKKTITKEIQESEDPRMTRNLLVIYAKMMFPERYKKANEWLIQQGVKISEPRYYEIVKEMEENAFERLSKRGTGYMSIVADMGDKLDLCQSKIWEELQKKKPNPVIISGYSGLIRLQPLISAYDKQVKRLIEQAPKKENESLTI